MSAAEPTVVVRHVRVDLALHQLREAEGRPLLLLHGLGERTPDDVPRELAAWPGPVWGLDFTGHGASTIPAGGGYTAEGLMADTDHALQHLGPVTLVGRGLGAYVGLLEAGARTDLVRGVILRDGPGLAGGGSHPSTPSQLAPPVGPVVPPDPYAMAELARDVRPPDYAVTYARLALQFSDLEEPIAVTSIVRPPWLQAVAEEPGVIDVDLPEALRRYASA